MHSRAADGRDAFDTDAAKRKVLSPPAAPRMEELHKLASSWVDTCEIGAFSEIATVARQREIIEIVATTVLLRNDMLDVVPQVAVFLTEQTIFTTVSRPPADKVSRGGIHR